MEWSPCPFSGGFDFHEYPNDKKKVKFDRINYLFIMNALLYFYSFHAFVIHVKKRLVDIFACAESTTDTGFYLNLV